MTKITIIIISKIILNNKLIIKEIMRTDKHNNFQWNIHKNIEI